MEDIRERIIEYYRRFHELKNANALPDDDLFVMEDEILSNYGLAGEESYLFHWGLQLKIATHIGFSDSQMAEIVAEYLSNQITERKNTVYFYSFKIVQIIFKRDSAFSVIIHYSSNEMNDNEGFIEHINPGLLVVDNLSMLEELLRPSGDKGSKILNIVQGHLDDIGEECADMDINSLIGTELEMDNILVKTERIEPDPSDADYMADFEVISIYPFLSRLFQAMDEANLGLHLNVNDDCNGDALSKFVMDAHHSCLALKEYRHILAGLNDWWGGHDSMKLEWISLISGVHYYLVKNMAFIEPHIIDMVILRILEFAGDEPNIKKSSNLRYEKEA